MIKRSEWAALAVIFCCGIAAIVWVQWLRIQAERGDPIAIVNYSQQFSAERTTELEAALKWKTRAASLGYCPAYVDLSRLYERSGDVAKSKEWLIAAAESSYDFALFLVVSYSKEGLNGFSKNDPRIPVWSQRLSELNAARDVEIKKYDGVLPLKPRMFCKKSAKPD